MKIFNKCRESGWGNKVNFVDNNNVVLGYDMDQCCCEHADWFLSRKVETGSLPDENGLDKFSHSNENDIVTLEGWEFDRSFFQEVNSLDGDNEESWYTSFDAGSMVVFRIVKGDEEGFVHLYNIHNGYYGHGFDFMDGEAVIQGGCL